MLKSAFEIANTRIISSKYHKILEAREEKDEIKIDFVPVPEFENREDKVLEVKGFSDKGHYVEETKLITDNEDDKEDIVPDIRIEEPKTITYGDKIMECFYVGCFKEYSGFAKMNRATAFSLSNRNVVVKIEDVSNSIDINKATQDQIKLMSEQEISPKAPKIYGMTVPNTITHAGRKIAYTMIETSEKAHQNYMDKLNMMDEVWVASKYGQNLLKRSNLQVPSFVMPLGVDSERYKPNCGIMDFGKDTRSFKFLTVARWSWRKGLDILLRAYMEEFSNDDDVSLVLVSRPLHFLGANGMQKIVEDFNDIKSFVNKPEEELPHVILYAKPTHERDMPKIYNTCNAFCLISRGEGFSLGVVEAAACGLPVIASNVTSHTDFLTKDNSFLVEPEGYGEAKSNGNMPKMAKLCHYYEGQMFPEFSRESIDKTKEHMRFVYENQKEAKEKAAKLRKLIVNNYTWDMAIDRIYNRLKEITE